MKTKEQITKELREQVAELNETIKLAEKQGLTVRLKRVYENNTTQLACYVYEEIV